MKIKDRFDSAKHLLQSGRGSMIPSIPIASFITKTKKTMGLEVIDEALFMGDQEAASRRLAEMKSSLSQLKGDTALAQRRTIRLLEREVSGQDSIASGLREAHIPLLVLRDLTFEHDGHTLKFDFIVISKKITFIIECKDLYGTIEANSKGEFIRSVVVEGQTYKDRIDNPIEQAKKRLEMVHQLRRQVMGNSFTRNMLDKDFAKYYQSIIVVGDPHTIFNAQSEKKTKLEQQVIFSDQLIERINQLNKASKEASSSDKVMYGLAQYFLDTAVKDA